MDRAILSGEKLLSDGGFIRVVDYMGGEMLLSKMVPDIYNRCYNLTSIAATSESWLSMCEVKLHFKMPISGAMWWLRERSASINEYSGRYSTMKDEFSSLGLRSVEKNAAVFTKYEKCLSLGVPKELSRIILSPDIFTYFYWKIDLQSLLCFLHNGFIEEYLPYPNLSLYLQSVSEIIEIWLPNVFQGIIDSGRFKLTLSIR